MKAKKNCCFVKLVIFKFELLISSYLFFPLVFRLWSEFLWYRIYTFQMNIFFLCIKNKDNFVKYCFFHSALYNSEKNFLLKIFVTYYKIIERCLNVQVCANKTFRNLPRNSSKILEQFFAKSGSFPYTALHASPTSQTKRPFLIGRYPDQPLM